MDLYDELQDLVLAYSNDKIKYLAKWVLDYRKADDRREAELRLEKLLYLKRFRRMAEASALAKPKERAAGSQELFEYYSSFVKPMIPNRHRFAVDELCYKGRWTEAADAIDELEGEIEADRYESEYERLVTDTEYLIDQLARAMKAEYGKRLEGARKALGDYIGPHKAALERLEKNLFEAKEALARIEGGGLPPEDKAELSGPLGDRIRTMEQTAEREARNARGIKASVDGIRKTYLVLESVISSLERKREQLDERRSLAELSRKLEIETSELDELFSGLDSELDRSMEKARTSMDLLADAFQEKIVDIIGDQEKLNRLLESEKAAREEGESQAGALDRACYEDILKILKGMNG